MITANLKGGLSNQMFQIAAIYSLAFDNNDECAFPLDNYVPTPQCKKVREYKTNIFQYIWELPATWKPEYTYYEPDLNYTPIPYHPNMMIDGYFPSEKYFVHHKKEIFELFKNWDILNELKKKFSKILSDSVSFHIRRGDYLLSPTHLPLCTKDYYDKALTNLEELKKVKHILVFSDDIYWCKETFNDKRIIFIEGQQDYEDFYLMSLCDNNIIANSGFSWWASYLNENPDRIIYAPVIWFGIGGPQNIKDNYLEEMIRI